MLKTLLENAFEQLSEVPEMLGSDSPACHRVKIARSNLSEALNVLAKEAAAAPAPAPAADPAPAPAP